MGSSVNYPNDHATVAAQSVFTSAARGAKFESAAPGSAIFPMIAVEDAARLKFAEQAKFAARIASQQKRRVRAPVLRRRFSFRRPDGRAAEPQQHRGSDVHRAIGASDDAHQERKREAVNTFAAEEIQDHNH
jgi:hypothetical protein